MPSSPKQFVDLVEGPAVDFGSVAFDLDLVDLVEEKGYFESES